ncbi:hypothetical protein GQ44DRAFT_57385 [Phaeosphaeriaceae sp. PMI808]|nr:hypothetical protein GQ44DRAFT_57385 [Phaeosphaeriaceae sp. PMI808]
MARSLPPCIDTVIIGNGPSALILSYILHGHIPYYIGGHQDTILDSKLSKEPNLLYLTPDLYAHFASSLRYSTQALPVNTLLDTLIRPNADTELNPTSCIEWRYEPERAISHVAIGEAEHAGGQWADNPVSASADIGTLSYAEQLSLPGYSYADHLAKREAQDQCDFVRPSRVEFAEYLKAYPEAVGIESAVFAETRVDNVYRTKDGFTIGSLGIRCKHLVLASGTFTVNIPPPPLLAPVAQLDSTQLPLLVIGSGFSAADVIISAPTTRSIIHIYQWAPEKRPSPLRGCHHSAYPEYATVYRQMKLAALAPNKNRAVKPPMLRRKSNPFLESRDWQLYQGLPNAEVTNVSSHTPDSATITIRLSSGEHITRHVGGLSYVVGRRGSLSFLSPSLITSLLTPQTNPPNQPPPPPTPSSPAAPSAQKQKHPSKSPKTSSSPAASQATPSSATQSAAASLPPPASPAPSPPYMPRSARRRPRPGRRRRAPCRPFRRPSRRGGARWSGRVRGSARMGMRICMLIGGILCEGGWRLLGRRIGFGWMRGGWGDD